MAVPKDRYEVTARRMQVLFNHCHSLLVDVARWHDELNDAEPAGYDPDRAVLAGVVDALDWAEPALFTAADMMKGLADAYEQVKSYQEVSDGTAG